MSGNGIATIDPYQRGGQIERHVDFSREEIDTIKQTIAQDVTDAELSLFLATARRTGLDPMARQIYAVSRWNGQAKRKVMTIQTGIDGYRLVGMSKGPGRAAGEYRGAEHQWTADGATWLDAWLPDASPAAARSRLLRADGAAMPWAVVLWREYVDLKDGKPTAMWARMPATMIAKCAEAQAWRRACPQDLSGVYTPEEMDQAGPTQGVGGGWATENERAAAHDAFAARCKHLTDAQRAEAKQWKAEQGYVWPTSAADLAAMNAHLDRLLDDAPADAEPLDPYDPQPSPPTSTPAPPAGPDVGGAEAGPVPASTPPAGGDPRFPLREPSDVHRVGGGALHLSEDQRRCLIYGASGGRTESAGDLTGPELAGLSTRMGRIADGGTDIDQLMDQWRDHKTQVTSAAPTSSVDDLDPPSAGRARKAKAS